MSAASFTVTSSTSISAVTPAVTQGLVNVTVTNSGGTSAISTRDQFTFTLTPRISSVSPSSGTTDGGTSVTISGVNFTGATAVYFGGVPATFKVASDKVITAVSPAGADSGITVDIVVSSPRGTSAVGAFDRFTYTG
jgi:IPT/TIG domain-containing protein